MEHPALRDIAQAIESIGIRIYDGHCVAPCRQCKRNRRWKPEEVASKRITNLLFCTNCLRGMQLATTQKSENIIA